MPCPLIIRLSDGSGFIFGAKNAGPDLINYMVGNYPPNYPVPAIPIRVGWEPGHPTQMFPSAYWWVTSKDMLWSFFKEWGFVREHVWR